MKISVSRSDVIWNWIGIIVSLCSNFLMIPFLIYFLDSETYGLWNVFVSLGSISVLFDFGFNAMFSRNISYCWGGVDHLQKEGVAKTAIDADTNYSLLGKVIKTCQLIYLLISLIALLCLVTVGSFYIMYISVDIYSSRILVAWLIYSLGVFLNLFFGYYDAFLRGVGEIGRVNKIRTMAKAVQITSTIVLLFFNFDIVGVAIAYVIYGAIFRFLCKKAFFSKKEISCNVDLKEKVKKKEIQEIFLTVWHNAWKDGIVSIANYVSNQVTTIVCSLYLGLSATGEFGLIVQLFSAVAQIAASLFNVYQPTLQEAYARRIIERLRKIVSFSLIMYIFLYVLGALVVIFAVVPILKLIKPQMEFAIGILLLICIYQGLLKYRDCYVCYLAGSNRLIYYKSFIISAGLCLMLAFWFLGTLKMGMYGLAIAQIISQCVFNVWYWPRIVDKELGLNFRKKIHYFIDTCKLRSL